MTSTGKTATGERADLLDTLAKHRYFLRYTVRNLTDEQAAQHTTVSQLCLGGLVKHVALVSPRAVVSRKICCGDLPEGSSAHRD